jgi:hypothetical protein
LSFDAQSVHRSLVARGLVDFAISANDVEAALVFAEGLGHIKKRHAEMGATVYWQAPSGGVLAAERNGWET